MGVQKFFKVSLLLFLTASSINAVLAAKQPVVNVLPVTVQARDAECDKLFLPNAKLEVLARGLGWGEGLAWDKTSGYVYYSDVSKNFIRRWKEGTGTELFRASASKDVAEKRFSVDGLLIDKAGHIIIAGHRDRRVARLEYSLALTTLADTYDGKRLNSPNDLIFDSQDNLYFTDPPYGLKGKNDSPEKELKFNGVYRLSKEGKLTLLVRNLTWPNGIAFSPDEKTLYVSISDQQKPVVMAYDFNANGKVSNGRVFFDASPYASTKQGLPNGMIVDKDGNLFLAGPGGVFILSPNGKHLGTILIADYTTNCAWGDDGSTLYITTAHTLCRLKMKTKGTGF